MKKYYSIAAIPLLFLIVAGSIFQIKRSNKPEIDSIGNLYKTSCNRIVSMSPSITETLFAIGLGDRVVGVTRFCRYPPEALEKEKIGGYMDPNYEAIAKLEPDLVLILPEQEKVCDFLTELGLKYLTVNNKKISDIIDTILTIGKVCGAEKIAGELAANINSRLKVIQDKVKDLPQPRVLISIGRTMGTTSLEDVYVAGRNTFFDELIGYAGGINAFERHGIDYPVLSAEGFLYLNPDIIIDMVPDIDRLGLNKTLLKKEWENISGAEAVKNNRVYILSGDYTVIPGPRFILLLEDLLYVIHPEVFRENL